LKSTGSQFGKSRLSAFCGALCVSAAMLSGLGCAAAGVFAIAAKGVEESRPKKVKAEYTGLAGKSFAVVVSADRAVQSEYPALVTELTARINDRLWTNSGATAGVPAQELLKYLYENPSWTARPYAELATTLSVERLVIVDLNEFRLHDPGNRYLWDGIAAGTVSVIEADGSLADEFIFQRAISVGFPDVTGVEQDKFTGQQVASVLMARFVNRASWLFYDHEEEALIPY
jgi:hypothetical protein